MWFRCRRLLYAAAVLAVALPFFSCVTADPYVPVDAAVLREEFSLGAEVLEKNSKKIYRNRDKVLYCLDKGMLSHYAGNWTESSSLLEEGERAIEENFAVSVSQEIGTYIFNDRTREYDGEDYEDLYLNVFNALNYYQLGEIDEALVEIRRMNIKLRNLSVKYGVVTSNLQRAALNSNTDIPPNPEALSEFSNSALARYLGMIFYRGDGAEDDARIDRDQIKIAFADAPSVYSYPVPASVDEELDIPPGMARLNVIGFSGRVPVKTEEVVRVPLLRNWIKIALPVLTPRPSRVGYAEVVLDGGERFNLELLEDMEKTARETFLRKKNIIYMKTIIRATTKGVSAAAFDVAAQANSDEDDGSSLIFSLLSIGAQIFTEASEKADLRSSRYFPAKAWVGGINLPPGVYSFTVNFRAGSGDIVAARRFEDVTLSAARLNLTEAVCLK
ncbi:MAG: hypothetical protein LBI67_07880 [Treponema sp.]|jgi:hypothetical protein|nr:hypothetical protein [Treponema sp.]